MDPEDAPVTPAPFKEVCTTGEGGMIAYNQIS